MVIMYRSAYGTKWQWYEMVMVRKGFSLWYEMDMVRNDCNSKWQTLEERTNARLTMLYNIKKQRSQYRGRSQINTNQQET